MTPVIIVGAGPVGLTTALLLARWKIPTIVLEAEDGRDEVGSKAICFQRDVLDVFHRVGIADAMLAEGVTWTTGRTYYRDHELFVTTFPESTGYPPWINISQASVERHLWSRVAEQPLIEVRRGHRVTGLEQYADRVVVRVENRAGIVGSHVVGCDGAGSTVRKLTGITADGHTFDDRFLIADIRADLPFPKERRFYFDPPWNPGRQVLVHQCPDSVWRIDWQVPPTYDLRSDPIDERIRRVTGGLPYEIVWLSVYRFHQRVARAFSGGRVFLAGDAAHLYAPFGARGLNSGVQDAENLAWKLAFVRHGWAVEGLLDSYDVERRAAALENLRVTGATMEFLVPQTDEQRERRRRTLERAITDPGARPLIDSGKLAEPYRYDDSPLTTLGTAIGAAVMPGMLCPDRPVAGGRLREWFGGGFVVLAGTGADVERARKACADARAPVDVRLVPGLEGFQVIRPDGHLTAALPPTDTRPPEDGLLSAVARATAQAPT